MTTIGYFHNGTGGAGGMSGAPGLSGTAGDLIGVLDACLVNGWGSGTVDSVVIAAGIATVTRAAGVPFDVDSVAEIAGATVSGGSINGRQKVLSLGPNSYTFAATGIADQTATGTITHKVASLGWSKVFSGTNLAVYRAPEGNRFYLRVDDTGTQEARVRAYESMSDVNTGSAEFPTTAQQAGAGLYVAKSTTANATVRDWVLIGNRQTFYMNIRWNTGTYQAATWGFGDFDSNKSVDGYATFINAAPNSYSASASTVGDLAYTSISGVSNSLYLARGVSGAGGSINAGRAFSPVATNTTSAYSGSNAAQFLAYPNPANSELFLSTLNVLEISPLVCFRGVIPGAYFCPMAISDAFTSRARDTGVSSLSGRAIRALLNAGSGNAAMFIDVTGPWSY